MGGGGRGKQVVLSSMWKWLIFDQNDWASATLSPVLLGFRLFLVIACTIDVILPKMERFFQIWSMLAGYEELAGDLSQSEAEKYFK